MKKRNISSHAMKRMIEREVISRNIKLKKRQYLKNEKKAYQMIEEGLNNYFAVAVSADEKYEYKYSELSSNGLCNKYVICLDTENLITVINNVDFEKEIKKHKVQLRARGNKFIRYFLTDYVYKVYDENKFLFVVSVNSKNICSFKFVESLKKVV